ncbi:MAG: right-handed parallel beta-helix repeat-containing protein [Armatimonadota bacterium]|nr:right-handed parallel beta-helix repeat-containing protein [Armatimonadota bacterium]
MKTFAVIVLISSILIVSPVASSSVVYVNVNRPGSFPGNGSSWGLAYHGIQQGINKAAAGDDVWVARGTYAERITLKLGVALYGGFAGNESDRDLRDWKANETVLDAQNNGYIVTVPTGAAADTRIDGFTLQNGWTIQCWYSSPTISHNVLKAIVFSAIVCYSSSPTISDNVFTGSTGGVISCQDSSAAVITGNLITSNKGSAVGCIDSSPLISNNRIIGNTANVASGIWCARSSPTISGNVFARNRGAAVLCEQGSSPAIVCNTITTHRMTEYAFPGVGVLMNNSSPTICNNIIAFCDFALLYAETGSAPVIRSNCDYGNRDAQPYPAPGFDVSADPQFVDPANDDYHLAPGSPCINKGWNDAPGLPALDMDGEGRIASGLVDIGADELWPTMVEIEVIPSKINLRSNGLVGVIVYSTESIDATSLDPTALRLAGAAVAARGNGSLHCDTTDVDADGDLDLVLKFRANELALDGNATSITLTGVDPTGWPIEGTCNVVTARG